MKTKHITTTVLITISVLFAGVLLSCTTKPAAYHSTSPADTIVTNLNGTGQQLVIEFTKGEAHNHPTMAFWVETLDGQYLQTLYVTRSVATGFFGYGELSETEWQRDSGPAYRPAALPYWFHRNSPNREIYVPTTENPIPDTYSGATPKGSFLLKTHTDNELPRQFRLIMEINQTWDWNRYWTNSKYPDNLNYKTSCQPALVYAVTIDLDSPVEEYYLNPIGHSHYAGENGWLYTDLSTMTTALDIAEKIKVKIP